jgi:acyl-CoA reductase-like NAD-dependent aldehyde dehydrogenase
MATKHGILIDGIDGPAASGESFDVFAPETGAVIGRVAQGGPADIDRAVASAIKGFSVWSGLEARARELVLLRAADIIETTGMARLLDLLIDESGSTITKASAEIAYTPDLLRAAAGEARRLMGDTFPNDRADRMSFVVREPIGVVGVLSPYNAPLSLLAKMTAFALAAGNAIVIKPSEETPLIALEYARILIEAGLPANAISVVTGMGASAGVALVEHPQVDAIALTGATHTGRLVAVAAAKRLRRVQLELGGKNALVVLKDYDAQAAAEIACAGIFTHAGQICMANSRIIVEAPLFEDFCAAFKAKAEGLFLGDLRDPKTSYGPLINQRAVDKVIAQQEAALSAGAILLSGGKLVRGLTYAPTILLEPPRTSAAWREESFGPICSVVRATDFAHAINLANDSDYGLSAGVLTHDVNLAFSAARQIKAGSVHIGMHPFQSNALAPIGGYRDSGIGRSGGKYSVEEFTELKWISLDAPHGS